MGTSKSSLGPGSGVPLVPSWADSDPASNDNDQIAQKARFGPARTQLGRFASTGLADEMRSGFGHYVKKGLGGASTAVRRMGSTVKTASALYSVLSSAPDSQVDLAILAGQSADETINTLVEILRPIDGTQDAEANRKAIRDTLSELLTRYPEADLANLSEEHCVLAVNTYIAFDVYHRFVLDVGKVLQDKAPTATDALSRLSEVKQYVKEMVLASFRNLEKTGRRLDSQNISEIAHQCLLDTFEVFEDYVE